MGSRLFLFSAFWIMLPFSCSRVPEPAPPAPERSATRNRDTASYELFQRALAACRFNEAMEYEEKYYLSAAMYNDSEAIFLAFSGMFDINLRKGSYDRAFEYVNQLYDIAERSGDPGWIEISLLHLGQLCLALGEVPEALSYLSRSWRLMTRGKMSEAKGLTERFPVSLSYAEALGESGQSDSARKYFDLARQDADTTHLPEFGISWGEFLVRQRKFSAATDAFSKGLKGAAQRQDTYTTVRGLAGMAEANLALDRPQAALNYGHRAAVAAANSGLSPLLYTAGEILYKTYDRLGVPDSANEYFRKYSVVREAIINVQTQGRLSLYAYEQRLGRLTKEKETNELRADRATLQKNILLGAIIAIFLFSVLLFRYITLKRRDEVRRRQLMETELLVQRLESAKATAELREQKATVEMQALRARMNPHFIFNCLNAINRYIIRNDTPRASDYLTKFARLIRRVLEKSGADLVTLDSEIDALSLYMDLEAVRFDHPFVYQIKMDGIDGTRVAIPPLVLQPFIENAIWHGLYPDQKQTGKITIDLRLDTDVLYCEIADNGIGFRHSEFNHAKKEPEKQSLGMALTRQRLQLAGGSGSEVIVRELSDEAGKATGTCICVSIPIEYL